MALVKYDTSGLIAALRPGISVIVLEAFKEELEEKINGIVQEIYDNMKKELPDKIEEIVASNFTDLDKGIEHVRMEITLSGDYIGNK
jgi:hypothetical protein